MREEWWLPVVGYEGLYSVSSHGRIRSEDRVVVEKSGMTKRLKGRVLKQQANRGGYLCLNLCRGSIRDPVRAHAVVARAFIGAAPSDRHEVAHIDGNRKNNRADNLRWDTRAGNFADKVAHGTHNRGERHPLSKLSNADVALIRSASMSASQAAATFRISQEHVKRVMANEKRRNG